MSVDRGKTFPNFFFIIKNMKKGLVLEGGAMRGMFTAGVIDVFMENGIDFDGIIGVSAGATFGANYKSKQPGRAVRYNKRFMKDPRYCSFRNLIFTGNIFETKFCYETMPYEIDVCDWDTFTSNPQEFYCVVSDCVTGKPINKKLTELRGSEMDWLRASASMPLVSKPVKVDGYTLLDGGMTDSIPLKAFENLGYEKNVVVLTQPRDYVKKPASLMGLMKILLYKYPKLVEAMKNRHQMYNDETKYVFEREKTGQTYVICPDESLNISRLEKNPEELQRVYDRGREVAIQNIEKIKAFLDC